MGDRSSIIIRQHYYAKDQGIEIYGHWAGTGIVNNLQKALSRSEGRWNDEEYFTRIVIQNILDYIAVADSLTGCGIGIVENYKKSGHGDLEYPPVIVDAVERKVFIGNSMFYFRDIVDMDSEVVLQMLQGAMLGNEETNIEE